MFCINSPPRFARLHCSVDCCAAIVLLTPFFAVSLEASEPTIQMPQSEIGSQLGDGNQPLICVKSPMRIGNSIAAGDGGTLFIEMIDADNKQITLSISQNSFEQQVPHDTLFLDVADPFNESDHRLGRLPKSDDEVREVIRLLRLAVENPKSSNTSIAKNAIRRLEQKKAYDTRDPSNGREPKWYAAYEAERQQARKASLQNAAAEVQFMNCFPPEAQDLLRPSSAEPLSDRQIGERADKLASVFFDKQIDMAIAIFSAFGAKGDASWTSLDESDLILMEALGAIEPDELVASLSRIENNKNAMLGAARVLFDPSLRYANRLDESEWRQWIPRYVKIALSSGIDGSSRQVIEMLSKNEGSTATLLLRDIAADTSLDNECGVSIGNQEIGLRDSACLALALRNDWTIKELVGKRLASAVHAPDRAALEVCMALLGGPEYLRKSHFELRSRLIGLAALKAIEKYAGRCGIDILIYSALNRSSGVQEEAIFVAQRLSGQKWLPSEDTERTRSYSDDAAEWWKTNPNGFLQPFTARDIP